MTFVAPYPVAESANSQPSLPQLCLHQRLCRQNAKTHIVPIIRVIKAVARARDLGFAWVTLMLGCDEEGTSGTDQVLSLLAEEIPARLAWSSSMADGRFKGRQPESLTAEEWFALSTGP